MRDLEDSGIIALFNERSQKAITELSEKYGKTALLISLNILKNEEDAQECINDSYLALWNRIPPEKPDSLKAYLFKTVRNQAIIKYRFNTAKKRNSFYDTALSELEETFSSDDSIENEIDSKNISDAVNSFLATLSKENRIIFVRRYFYGDNTGYIAGILDRSPHFISVRLSRIRENLRKYLTEEGLI